MKASYFFLPRAESSSSIIHSRKVLSRQIFLPIVLFHCSNFYPYSHIRETHARERIYNSFIASNAIGACVCVFYRYDNKDRGAISNMNIENVEHYICLGQFINIGGDIMPGDIKTSTTYMPVYFKKTCFTSACCHSSHSVGKH